MWRYSQLEEAEAGAHPPGKFTEEKMLPKGHLTHHHPTRRPAGPAALTEQPLFIEIEGFLEEDLEGVFPETLRGGESGPTSFRLDEEQRSVPAGLALRVLAGLHLSETADGEGRTLPPPAGPPRPCSCALQPLPHHQEAGG